MITANAQNTSPKDRLLHRGKVFLSTAIVSVISIACSQSAGDFTQLTFLAAESRTESAPVSTQTLAETQAVLEERLAELGIEEASVAVEAPNKIVVDLPHSADTDAIEQSLIRNGQLAFRMQLPDTTDDLSELLRTIDALIEAQENPQLTQQQADALQREIDATREAVLALFGPAEITGVQVAEAMASPLNNTSDLWQINLRFDDEGERRFAEITSAIAGTGRSIGIFVDNRLISAPAVSEQYAQTGILGGEASISSFDAEEAMMLALQFDSGELPLQLTLLSITSPEAESSELEALESEASEPSTTGE